MNWYKEIKLALPLSRYRPWNMSYFDVGHDSFNLFDKLRGKKVDSLPEEVQQKIAEHLDKDKIWYIHHDYSIQVKPALWIDEQGKLVVATHSGMPLAKGRYDHFRHMVSLMDFSYDKNPKKLEHIKKRIHKILDDTFNNPTIYEL